MWAILFVTVGRDDAVLTGVSSSSPYLSKWAEYILFASLLLVVCFIFSIMAHFYTYIDPAKIEAQFKKKLDDDDDDDDDDEDNTQKKIEMVKKASIESHNYNSACQTKL